MERRNERPRREEQVERCEKHTKEHTEMADKVTSGIT